MEGICYIIGAGAVDALTLEPGVHDYVIAADAGYTQLHRLSVAADLVVGDFDSLEQPPIHPNVKTYPCEKDETDMMLALDAGLRLGYKTFVLLGGLGGRLDHTLANIQTLSYLAQCGARGFLIGGGTAITVIQNGKLRLDGICTGSISVFSMSDVARGVTLKDLKYPLNGAQLTDSVPLGVSNAFAGQGGSISVAEGRLLVLWEESAVDVIDRISDGCYCCFSGS